MKNDKHRANLYTARGSNERYKKKQIKKEQEETEEGPGWT